MGEDGSGKRFVVQIPSAAEVEHHSSVRVQPLNFFRPSTAGSLSSATAGNSSSAFVAEQQKNSQNGQGQASTFTEAFSFLRNTEFYSPPPAAPPLPSHSTATASTSGAPAPTAAGNFKKEDVFAAAAQTGQSRNAILVSRRQQGNSVLKHIRNARWMFADVVPDYILGQTSCALYLSLRYHLLHPDYIYFRIRELQKSFRLRVVLCHVDVDDVIKPLHEVTKTCLLHDCSLLCAWSQEECARYLETIKIYENKPADYIQERTDSDYLSRLTSSLTTVRHVNKTDVLTLGSTFGTLSAIFNSSMEDLARCPGIGERKVKRLYDCFNEPFRRIPASKLRRLSKGGNSPSGAAEGPVHTSQADAGPPGCKPTKEADTEGQGVVPTSKLINREGEVSVHEALTAARRKLSNSTTSKSEACTGKVMTEKNVDPLDRDIPETRKSIQQPPERNEEEFVISLDD